MFIDPVTVHLFVFGSKISAELPPVVNGLVQPSTSTLPSCSSTAGSPSRAKFIEPVTFHRPRPTNESCRAAVIEVEDVVLKEGAVLDEGIDPRRIADVPNPPGCSNAFADGVNISTVAVTELSVAPLMTIARPSDNSTAVCSV